MTTTDLPTDPAEPDTPGPDDHRDAPPAFAPAPLAAVLGAAAVAALAARFFQPSPLWGREAVEVTLAQLPLGELTGALRHAGGPPLWIFLLHAWESVFGTGDAAVRALPAILSIATVPAMAVLGNQLGGHRLARDVALVAALSPCLLRYGSDAGPAALVILLTTVAALCMLSALNTSSRGALAGIAVTTSALLWTHYWTAPIILATAVTLAVVRQKRPAAGRSGPTKALIAIVVGAATFTPWLPTLWFQLHHAGTPWGDRLRPATILVGAVVELNGGTNLLLFVAIPLIVLGLFGTPQRGSVVRLDLHGRPETLGAATVFGATMVAASLMVLLSGTTFVPAYAAGLLVAFLTIMAAGLSRLDGTTRVVALIVLLVLGGTALVSVATADRSQVGAAVAAIRAAAPQGALVVACPGEVGPSLVRSAPRGVDVVGYPDLATADVPDWVGYGAALRGADPTAVAARVRTAAAGRPIFVVVGRGYRWAANCNGLVGALGGGNTILEARVGDFQELMRVYAMPQQ